MKKLLLWLWLLFTAFSLSAKDVAVKGYTRKDGTYVAPYHRTSPDSDKSNNYSSKGNINPYTGKEGTKDPYSTPSSPALAPYTPPPPSAPATPAAASAKPAPASSFSSALRGASFKTDVATLRLAEALLKDGWVYEMPAPKSPQAAWGNKDGRTTWWSGYWTNKNRRITSSKQPSLGQDGKYIGDGKGDIGWHNGGAPATPTKIEWLCSKSGGIEPSN